MNTVVYDMIVSTKPVYFHHCVCVQDQFPEKGEILVSAADLELILEVERNQ